MRLQDQYATIRGNRTRFRWRIKNSWLFLLLTKVILWYGWNKNASRINGWKNSSYTIQIDNHPLIKRWLTHWGHLHCKLKYKLKNILVQNKICVNIKLFPQCGYSTELMHHMEGESGVLDCRHTVSLCLYCFRCSYVMLNPQK